MTFNEPHIRSVNYQEFWSQRVSDKASLFLGGGMRGGYQDDLKQKITWTLVTSSGRCKCFCFMKTPGAETHSGCEKSLLVDPRPEHLHKLEPKSSSLPQTSTLMPVWSLGIFLLLREALRSGGLETVELSLPVSVWSQCPWHPWQEPSQSLKNDITAMT